MTWLSKTVKYTKDVTEANIDKVASQPWLYFKMSPMVNELLDTLRCELYNYNAKIEDFPYRQWTIKTTTIFPSTYPTSISIMLSKKPNVHEYHFDVWCEPIGAIQTAICTKTLNKDELQKTIIDSIKLHVKQYDELIK